MTGVHPVHFCSGCGIADHEHPFAACKGAAWVPVVDEVPETHTLLGGSPTLERALVRAANHATDGKVFGPTPSGFYRVYTAR